LVGSGIPPWTPTTTFLFAFDSFLVNSILKRPTLLERFVRTPGVFGSSRVSVQSDFVAMYVARGPVGEEHSVDALKARSAPVSGLDVHDSETRRLEFSKTNWTCGLRRNKSYAIVAILKQ